MSSNSDNIKINGFRFYNLEVFNWGTFDGKIYTIKPNGRNSLLTGDIGSGKSTLVDAISTLIVPNNKIIYNKAAGAESKERNLYSYIRGEHKSTKDSESGSSKPEYLRSDEKHSVILGNFLNAGYNQEIALAQVFWIKNGKADKFFIVASTQLTILEHLSNFEDIPKLKKRLKTITGIELFDSFKEYSVRFCQLFGINQREEALDLFNQTVSMKSVGNLTDFVRNQMLGKTDVKDSVDDVIKSFDSLTESYNAVLKAKRQIELLSPIVEDINEYDKVLIKIEDQKNILQDLQNYFSIEKTSLLKDALRNGKEDYLVILNKLQILKTEITSLTDSLNQLKQDLLNSDIGKQLESIERQIDELSSLIQKQKAEFESYSKICDKLKLSKDIDETGFYSNRKLVDQIEGNINAEQKELQSNRDKLKYDQRLNAEAKTELEEELVFLKTRNSQIPRHFVTMRNQIAEDLEIEPTEIPFIGELIQVKPEEEDWQGAIERRLHDFGLSILVKEKDFSRIRNYVDSTDLKNKIVYLRTLQHEKVNIHNIQDDSLVNKIDIKSDTEFYDWLEIELQIRHNLVCCETMEEFNREQFAITKNGQIRTGRTRYEKDDRRKINDKSNFILGWSNEGKIKAYINEIVSKETKQTELQKEIDSVESKQNLLSTKTLALNDFKKFTDFNSIDFKKSVLSKDEKEQELKLLKNSKDADQYNKLKEKQKEIEGLLETKGADEKELLKSSGKLESIISGHAVVLFECLTTCSVLDEAELKKYFNFNANIFEDLETHIDLWNSVEIQNDIISDKNRALINEIVKPYSLILRDIDTSSKTVEKKVNKDISEDENKNYQRENKINLGISKFLNEFPSEESDIDAKIGSKDQVKKLFEKINNDALPEYEERFRKMMREGTIKDLLIFSSKLTRDEKEIEKKINDINNHLSAIDYNTGTYIKIIENKVLTQDLVNFRNDLKNATQGVFGETEAFSEEKFIEVKKLLDKFKSVLEADKRWTEKVTDVRQWYTFGASERNREDHSEREYYSDSSGKSGGQKEKLAYTILASAIAYQFGLSWTDERSRSFRFVVIDEAFGKGSDESTRYGLKLFEKLNLQLLIVTPLQKINIIEEYINSVHFVSNPAGNKSLVRNLTKTEYVEERDQYLKGVKENA